MYGGRAGSSGQLTENGVVGVHGDLILGSVPDETLGLREGHIAGCRAVALIIGDDLDLAVLEDADAGVSRAKIDTDRGCLRHFLRYGSLQGKRGRSHFVRGWNLLSQTRIYITASRASRFSAGENSETLTFF